MIESNQKISTFFMFEGKANEAMNFYTSIFEESEINNILYQEDGSILHATFTIQGQTFMCIDSAIKHGFTFTPSISLFVTCDSEEETKEKFGRLSEGGKVLMSLASLPVSTLFGWVEDRFGVSWQLNFAKNNEKGHRFGPFSKGKKV